MKNRLYNRIIVCGLLSSSFALFGMETPDPGTLSTSTPTPHHQSLGEGIKHALRIDGKKSGNTSPTQLSPRDKSLKVPKEGNHHHSRSSSPSSHSSTSVPLDPSDPASLHHHHHNLHLGKKVKEVEHEAEKLGHEVVIELKKAEHFVLKYGNVVLQDIIDNPDIITDIFAAAGINQETAQAATTMIEAGSKRAQAGIEALDYLQQRAQAKKLAAEERATAMQQSEIQKVEGIVLAPLLKVLNFINNNPKIISFGLNEFLPSDNTATAMIEFKTFVPGLITYIQSLQPALGQPVGTTQPIQLKTGKSTVTAESGFGTYTLIGGGAMTFLALILMLHKINYLPANISQLLNNIISSALNQNLVQDVIHAV